MVVSFGEDTIMTAAISKPHGLVHSQDEITAFVEQLIWQFIEQGLYYQGPNRRKEKRHPINVSVRTTPLDENLHPAGDPFITTTRDISNGGIALIHSETVPAPFLAVELKDLEGVWFQAAVEILRRRPVGPFFEIAGKFVVKTYDPLKQRKPSSA
jgi:hypothetical protein